jgi:hypothetical protein
MVDRSLLATPEHLISAIVHGLAGVVLLDATRGSHECARGDEITLHISSDQSLDPVDLTIQRSDQPSNALTFTD